MGWFTKRSRTQAGATAGAEYAVMPEALRRAAASLKGHAFIPDDKVIKVLAEEVFPISTAIATEARQREVALKKSEEEVLKNLCAGQLIAGKGIYMGLYEPKDRGGKSLNQKYHAFAAPEDLKDSNGRKLVLTFDDMASEVGKRRNWHGYDGLYVKNDTTLYDVLRNGSYRGQWIMPDSPLLHGKDADGIPVTDTNLVTNKDEEAFAGTFTLTDSDDNNFPDWYWSLTGIRKDRDSVWSVRVSNGDASRCRKGSIRHSCRPVRLELVI